MAAMKNLFHEVMEGRVTIEQASVILGSQNPDIEYTPDQVQVLELMSQEYETQRDFDQMGEDAEVVDATSPSSGSVSGTDLDEFSIQQAYGELVAPLKFFEGSKV